MEPFTITCPTCQAGLRVGTTEAIGKILGCPNCARMVLIHDHRDERPLNSIEASATGEPHPEVFEETCDQIDELLEGSKPGAPPLQGISASATPDRAECGLSHAKLAQTAAQTAAVSVRSNAVHDRSDASRKRWRGAPRSSNDALQLDTPYLPDGEPVERDWIPAKQTRRRQKRIGLLLLVAVSSAFGWMAYQSSLVARDRPMLADAESKGRQSSDTSEKKNGTQIGREAGPKPKSATNRNAFSLTSHASDVSNGERGSIAKPKPVLAPAIYEETSANVGATSESSAPKEAKTANTQFRTPVATDTDDDLEHPSSASNREAIDHFGDIFGESPSSRTKHGERRPVHSLKPVLSSQPPPKRFLLPLRLPPELRARFEPVSVLASDALPMKPVDVEARLADPVADVQLNVGLSDLLKFVSQMSTIRFTVRPDGLRYSRVDPSVSTPVNETSSTIAELLRRGLAPHRLDFGVENGHVIIDRSGAISGRYTTNKHSVHDLIDAGVSPDEIVSLVKQLIDPFSWTAVDGDANVFIQDGSMVVRHNETAHFESMFLLERLRVARGMALQGTMDREEFRNDWQRTATFTQPVALRTNRNDTLATVTRKLNRLAGSELHILVNWQALAEHGWSESSPVSAELSRQPLATALPLLLEPMGLAHRCVGPRMIEITTQIAEAGRSELGIHSIGALTRSGYEPQTVIRQVEATIGEEYFRRGGGRGAIVYNDGAQSLLVRLPQSQQHAVKWVIRELARQL